MRVVDNACERTGPKATVVVEGKNVEEVKSLDARNLALDYARKLGLSVPGFTGSSWTEWVDNEGKSLLNEDFTKATTRFCRASYPVQEAAL
jgi:hypothetical protein